IFPNCEPIDDTRVGCAYPVSLSNRVRFLNGEVFNAMAQAYIYTRDESLKKIADEMYGGVFGNPAFGGLTTDAFYVNDIAEGGYSLTANKAKDFGFLFGMGFGAG